MSNDHRLRLLLEDARREQSSPRFDRPQHLAREEATFRDAARIGQIVTAAGASPRNRLVLDEAMFCFDRAAALRLCGAGLDRLATGPLADVAEAARASLVQRDGAALLSSAKALREAAASGHNPVATAACAALVLASVSFTAASTEKGEP